MASDSEPLGEPVRDEYEVEIQEIGFDRPTVFQYCKNRWKNYAIGIIFGTIGLFILSTVLALGIRFVEEEELTQFSYVNSNVALVNTTMGLFRGVVSGGAYAFLVSFILIVTGITLAMHYNPSVDLAFISSEH